MCMSIFLALFAPQPDGFKCLQQLGLFVDGFLAQYLYGKEFVFSFCLLYEGRLGS